MKKFAFIVMCLLSLCACSLSKRIAAATGRVEKMYEGTREWDALPLRTITWHQAVAMLREHNLELLESRDRISMAERRARSIYTDLIPGVSYYGYMTRYVSQISKRLSANELDSRVNVTFSIPTLTQVPYRVYASQVSIYAEVKAREGRERELISRLYQLVRTRQIEEAKRDLSSEGTGDSRDLAQMQKNSRRQMDEKYWQDVARILGSRDARWYILPESMPRVRWEDYNPLLDRPGELVICEMAIRMERARMAQYGVALTYLPTINTGIYSPALFSSTGGTYSGTFLNASDTRLNLNISYSLDTHLTAWDTYQDSKASYEREKIRVMDSLMEHRNKVRTLRDSMAEYSAWLSYMKKRMEYLRSNPPQTAEGLMDRAREISAMRMEMLNQEAASIEAEAAVVLEYGMPDEREKRTPAES